jgi:hypothetical protein
MRVLNKTTVKRYGTGIHYILYYMYACTYIHTYMYVSVCGTHTCMYVCDASCMYINIHIHSYMYVLVFMFVMYLYVVCGADLDRH